MYCTVDDVRQMLKSDLITALVGDNYIEDPAEREAAVLPIITQAVADAAAEIDGYLAKRYPVPLVRVPTVIGKYAKDIAVYNLVSRIGTGGGNDREQNYRKRYEDAVRFLEMLATGKVEIGLSVPAVQAATGFQMSGPSRIFSRDKLTGM